MSTDTKPDAGTDFAPAVLTKTRTELQPVIPKESVLVLLDRDTLKQLCRIHCVLTPAGAPNQYHIGSGTGKCTSVGVVARSCRVELVGDTFDCLFGPEIPIIGQPTFIGMPFFIYRTGLMLTVGQPP
jgi:hypothetical protein